MFPDIKYKLITGLLFFAAGFLIGFIFKRIG